MKSVIKENYVDILTYTNELKTNVIGHDPNDIHSKSNRIIKRKTYLECFREQIGSTLGIVSDWSIMPSNELQLDVIET